MAKLEIEIEDELLPRLEEAAARNAVSVDEFIELLVKMECSSEMTSRDGRRIKLRASMYRGYDVLLNDKDPQTGIF